MAESLLYHYTTQEGLIGIIDSSKIWATHVRFLNDYTELREAVTPKNVSALMASFRDNLPPDLKSISASILDDESVQEQILTSIGELGSKVETFVCSFATGANTESPRTNDPGDRLSQWRGYSRTSQGFSLGFERGALEKQVSLENDYMGQKLLSCVYEKVAALFEEIGPSATTKLHPAFERARSSMRSENLDSQVVAGALLADFMGAISGALAEFYLRTARVKHPGFAEEEEWRIVVHGIPKGLAPEIKFRSGPYGNTPYLEIPLGLKDARSSPLRRIVVGPSMHQEDVKRSVELLLMKHDISIKRPGAEDGVEISKSQIPYRSK